MHPLSAAPSTLDMPSRENGRERERGDSISNAGRTDGQKGAGIRDRTKADGGGSRRGVGGKLNSPSIIVHRRLPLLPPLLFYGVGGGGRGSSIKTRAGLIR